MKKYFLFLAIGMLFLSILACGSSDTGSDTSTDTAPTTASTTASLKILNNTQDITVCHLYTAPAGSGNWSEDQMQGDQIAPGADYTVTLDPGTYDLKVSDCAGANETTRQAQDINGPVEWTLNQEASAPTSVPVSGKVTLKITNGTQNLTVCFFYMSVAGSGDWGQDLLQGTRIEPGNSYSLDVDPGTYDLKAQTCDRLSTSLQNAVNLSTSTEWIMNQSTGPVTFRVQNSNPTVTICYLYMAPAGTNDWGPDMLRGEKIAPNDYFEFTVAQGHYKVRATDCSQTAEVVNNDLNVSGPSVWTVK